SRWQPTAASAARLPTATTAPGRKTSQQGGNPRQAMSWDHDSNRLSFGSSSFTYNADDSIASATTGGSTHSYSYQPFGGLQSDGCNSYAYDGFDRLSSWTAGCGSSGSQSYSNDGLDRQRLAGSSALHYD